MPYATLSLRLLAPLSALLLLSACTKDDQEDQPAPAPAELKGEWTRTYSYYKYTDEQGKSTNEGLISHPAPAPKLIISDATFGFKTTSHLNEYFYTRSSDSTAFTYYLYRNQLYTEKSYSIIELKEHSLVTRYAWKTLGGYFIEKEFYTR